LNPRVAGLDLVKWVAVVTMLGDHLRYLWPSLHGLAVTGRLAFPLFCLAIAWHVGRTATGSFRTARNGRYLAWMVVFSLVSEPAYRWLDNGSTTLNVMPTLTLGLLVAYGVQVRDPLARIGAGVALLVALLASPVLMYGLPGVLLPAGWLVALRFGGLNAAVPAALAVAGNLTNDWLLAHALTPWGMMVVGAAACSVPVGLGLLRQPGIRVWPVGRWAYGFYPAHLVAIRLLQGMV
jgi:hypothetical protein